jgi:hypothetical protein
MPVGPYMVAFNYGSVVFFAAGPKLRAQYLAIAREVAADPVSSDRPYVEGGEALMQLFCAPDIAVMQLLFSGMLGCSSARHRHSACPGRLS